MIQLIPLLSLVVSLVASDSDAQAVIAKFKEKDPGLAKTFNEAHGYVVFPTVGKGGLGIGAARYQGADYREIAVASVSAALFAALHAGNLLTGQSLVATAIQLVYTFAFGILMYLTLRVTGNLIWPILLHASTNPSTFLATLYSTQGPVAAVAGLGNPSVIVAGLVLLIFIRGRVAQSTEEGLEPPARLSTPGKAG